MTGGAIGIAGTACLLSVLLLMTGLVRGEEAHIRIESPGELTRENAEAIYRQVLPDAVAGYVISRDPVAQTYDDWQRFNETPYLSETHGNRYVNNYANRDAVTAGYGSGGEMPPGAILAKDSFTVTDDGDVFPGALFLMEKLPRDRSPETGNWRYWMIMPDGSLLGDSQDVTAGKVEFCHACHRQVAESDHLYFVPEAFRR